MSTAVAIVPRDRFSKAATVLRRVLEISPASQKIFVVDAGSAPRYRRQLERLARGDKRVEILRSEEWLDPNAAKNWVFREASDHEFVAWVENDTLPEAGWDDALIRACDVFGADVGRPMVFERKLFKTFAHFDPGMGNVERFEENGVHRFRFTGRDRPIADDVGMDPCLTTVMEMHALVMRRSAHEKIGGLDETLTTREGLDLSIQLVDADLRTVYVPTVEVTFLAPPPVEREERDYYLDRWDIDRSRQSNRHIERKWGFSEFPHSMDFVRFRHEHVSYAAYLRYFARWELSHWLRYGAYRVTKPLPLAVRRPIERALYG